MHRFLHGHLIRACHNGCCWGRALLQEINDLHTFVLDEIVMDQSKLSLIFTTLPCLVKFSSPLRKCDRYCEVLYT